MTCQEADTSTPNSALLIRRKRNGSANQFFEPNQRLSNGLIKLPTAKLVRIASIKCGAHRLPKMGTAYPAIPATSNQKHPVKTKAP